MKTSAHGRALIEQREGRRLVAYRDTEGILTIGVGHTGRMSAPLVTPGMKITEALCDAMLARDLDPVETAINETLKVPVSQGEFDALASLGFNIGTAGLKRSSVIKRLNLGDVQGAANAFMMWDRPLALVGRRKAEMAQFLAPESPGGDAGANAVGTARAATLATMAETTKARAQAAQSTAASLLVAGATAAATTHGHHPTLAAGLGGVLLAIGLCAALAAIASHRAALTLAANAGRQPSASAASAAKQIVPPQK